MELKNAKCPNCGATIKVNPDASVAICMYCQSEYEVQKGIDNYNISHQDVKEQNITGSSVNVSTQVIEHQTVINNVTRPRKFVTLPKDVDISVYNEIRYDLIDRRLVDNGTQYEYVFEREDKYSDDRELMAIEAKLDNDYKELGALAVKETNKKNAKNASIVGILFLLFIPAVGWAILFFVVIGLLISKASSKSKLKKDKARLLNSITTNKELWLETASRKGLLD